MTSEQEVQLLKDPFWRLNHLYKVKHEGQVLPFVMKPQQAQLYRQMWYKNVILKARQIGFTTIIQLFMLDQCLFNSNIEAGVIAHTMEDATKFFDKKIKFAYDNLPSELRERIPAVRTNKRELTFGNGSAIHVGTSLRSGSFDYLHVSEFGKLCAQFPDKAEEVVTGGFNTVGPQQFIFVESTAEGREGHFFDICERAERLMERGVLLTELDFRFFFFPWFEEPRYSLSHMNAPIPERLSAYFEQLEAEVGIQLRPGQKFWYVKKAEEQGDKMQQEFPSTPKEAFDRQLEGAIFAQQLRNARHEGRITTLAHERGEPVNLFWDLGRNDTTAIWFHQTHPPYDHFIDYYENRLVDIAYYIEQLAALREKKGYMYGYCYLPHDGKALHIESIAGSVEDILRRAGLNVRTVERPTAKIVSINKARKKFPFCRFDEEACAEGLKRLAGYQWTWDPLYKRPREKPLHNLASNGADAFQTFAMGHEPITHSFVQQEVHPLYNPSTEHVL